MTEKIDVYTIHSYKRLTRVRPEISESFLNALTKNNILTCKDFLLQPPFTLMKIIDINYFELIKLTTLIAKSIAPRPTQALSLLEDTYPLKTTLQPLDMSHCGGIMSGLLTEIVGPAGCGKTQFCLLLSLMATLPKALQGRDTDLIYIDTENTFSPIRFTEMVRVKFPEYNTNDLLPGALIKRVHLLRVTNCDSLINTIDTLEEPIIQNKIGLIILDSVASIVRGQFHTEEDEDQIFKRNSVLSKIAAKFKYLADSFKIPVVVTNQVTTAVDPMLSLTDNDGRESMQITAALGSSWAHFVNVRLILQFWKNDLKMMTIGKSPIDALITFPYSIEPSGLNYVPGLEDELPNSVRKLQAHSMDLKVKSDVLLF